MMIGDPAIWADQFRSLDSQFLQCVVAVWPKCLARFSGPPTEDQITINLVAILSKDKDARRLFHSLEYQYEPFGYDANGLAYSTGRIDLALLPDQERERYLAYECKRLNVIYGGVRRTLATPYVMEGLIRFVTEQYAGNLPVGCMLGYVMDGDVQAARSSVCRAIRTNQNQVSLVMEPEAIEPLDIADRFLSRHRRPSDDQEIEIRHALLPL